MNTEQLKTAEEIFAEQMEDYKTRLMASILDFHSKHPIKELTDFASQESKRAVDEFKDDLRRKIKEAQGGISNISMSSRAIIEDIVLKELNR